MHTPFEFNPLLAAGPTTQGLELDLELELELDLELELELELELLEVLQFE